jgi:hypothetical protein
MIGDQGSDLVPPVGIEPTTHGLGIAGPPLVSGPSPANFSAQRDSWLTAADHETGIPRQYTRPVPLVPTSDSAVVTINAYSEDFSKPQESGWRLGG